MICEGASKLVQSSCLNVAVVQALQYLHSFITAEAATALQPLACKATTSLRLREIRGRNDEDEIPGAKPVPLIDLQHSSDFTDTASLDSTGRLEIILWRDITDTIVDRHKTFPLLPLLQLLRMRSTFLGDLSTTDWRQRKPWDSILEAEELLRLHRMSQVMLTKVWLKKNGTKSRCLFETNKSRYPKSLLI